MSGPGGKRLVADRRDRTAKAGRTKTGSGAPRKRTTKPARRKAPRRGPIGLLRATIGWVLRLIWKITWRTGLLAAVILAGTVFYVRSTLPPIDTLLDARVRGSVTMLDRNGKVFAWRGDQYGGTVQAGSVSKYLREAVIATEDKRFYHHFGVSPRGIASAMLINMREGRSALSGNGGSTITQQVAKLLCMGNPYDPTRWKDEAAYEEDCRQSNLWRKAREAVYALALESKYSKDEILTIYLNRAYLGAGSRGFEAASQRYFGKHAAEVGPAEAAMLAGLLSAPSRFAPTTNLARSRNRANVVIGLMADQGYLTPAEAKTARTHPAELSPAAEARAGGYFADWAMDTAPAFLTSDTTEDVELHTTFDPRIQKAAESALTAVFDEKLKEGSEAQAAIVVMSADGAVRAMVGGRRFQGVAGQFNRAIQARRQTGSSFKPFVYAAALDRGFTPYDTVVDEPITINVKGSGPWSPQNYDHKFSGRVTLVEAFKRSLNIPAVKVAQAIGLENVRRIAADFGIESSLALGPALALGVSESTLLEMTGAYAGILNGGSSVTPFGIEELRIKGDDTALMGKSGGMGERVITETAAQELVYMMSQVIESGTGTRARLPGGRPAAGKTGTTQAARDAWFLGFTADYVVGVWMGYDDNRPLTGVTGSGLPAEIWRETMTRISDGLPVRPLPMLNPGAPPAVAPAEPEPVLAPAGVSEADILQAIGDALRGQ